MPKWARELIESGEYALSVDIGDKFVKCSGCGLVQTADEWLTQATEELRYGALLDDHLEE